MPTLPKQPQPDNKARTSDAPKLVSLPAAESKLSKCPACLIGVLYVTAYDPDASHETGNEGSSRHEHFEPSGGSQIVTCFNCGIKSSQPLNAGGES